MTAARQTAPSFTGAFRQYGDKYYDFAAKEGDKNEFTADELKKEFLSADKRKALNVTADNMYVVANMGGVECMIQTMSDEVPIFLTGKEAEQFKSIKQPQYKAFFNKLFGEVFQLGGNVKATTIKDKDIDLYI